MKWVHHMHKLNGGDEQEKQEGKRQHGGSGAQQMRAKSLGGAGLILVKNKHLICINIQCGCVKRSATGNEQKPHGVDKLTQCSITGQETNPEIGSSRHISPQVESRVTGLLIGPYYTDTRIQFVLTATCVRVGRTCVCEQVGTPVSRSDVTRE